MCGIYMYGFACKGAVLYDIIMRAGGIESRGQRGQGAERAGAERAGVERVG